MSTVISIIFIFLLVLIFYFIYKFYKAKKNIWQKISFLYNSLYSLLILDYCQDWTKNQSLKEEINDFYQKIVLSQNLWIKINEWEKIKSFMLDYLENSDLVTNLYKTIETYTGKTYKNLENSINNLVISTIIITIIYIIAIIKI